MKSTRYTLLALIAIIFTAVNCSAVEMSIKALTNTESQVPSSFANVVKNNVDDMIVFKKKAIIYNGTELNRIFQGYGLKLSMAELEKTNSKIPSSFARIVKNGDSKKIVFGSSFIIYSPATFNAILNAYGVHLPMSALKNKQSTVPDGYAKIVKEKDSEEVAFSNTFTALPPSTMNDILTAYQ